MFHSKRTSIGRPRRISSEMTEVAVTTSVMMVIMMMTSSDFKPSIRTVADGLESPQVRRDRRQRLHHSLRSPPPRVTPPPSLRPTQRSSARSRTVHGADDCVCLVAGVWSSRQPPRRRSCSTSRYSTRSTGPTDRPTNRSKHNRYRGWTASREKNGSYDGSSSSARWS